MNPTASAPTKLAADLQKLADRAAIRTIPCEALCWDLGSDTFRLRNWDTQRAYLESLAQTIEDLAGRLPRSTLEENVLYQHAVSCSLSQIARLRAIGPFHRLVNVTANCAWYRISPSLFDGIVAVVLALQPVEVELLALYQSLGVMIDADIHDQSAGFVLGGRSANLGSESIVETAAQRLQDLGLVEMESDLPLDFSRRYLAPRALTDLGRMTMILLSQPTDSRNLPAI
jgi:hypothetical protein